MTVREIVYNVNYEKLQGQNLVQYKNVNVLVEDENWQLTGFTGFTK